MSKILTAVGAGIFAFVLGFVGLYFAMPMISPDQVIRTQVYLDSLKLSRGFDLGTDPLAVYDSLNSLRGHLDSLVGMGAFVRGAIESQNEVINMLQDSITVSRDKLSAMEREHTELLGLFDELTARVKTVEGQNTELTNLSSTLSKLDDRELKAIVAEMDLVVLRQLYDLATDRERKKLLAAMPPERAARLVSQMVRPTSMSMPSLLPENRGTSPPDAALPALPLPDSSTSSS